MTTLRRTYSTLLLVSLLGIFTSPLTAAPVTNLITNGDFSQGFAGFTSDYTFVANDGPDACWDPNTVTVGTSASACHPLWNDPSHAGSMLIMNGAAEPAELLVAPRATQQTAYRTQAQVTAGQTYRLSSWLTNLCCNFDAGYAAATLSWWMNDQLLGVALTAQAGVSVLSEFLWTATSSALANLELRNDQARFRGNDFALQDVRLEDTTVTPEPGSMLLLGTGLLGLGKALRRAKNRA